MTQKSINCIHVNLTINLSSERMWLWNWTQSKRNRAMTNPPVTTKILWAAVKRIKASHASGPYRSRMGVAIIREVMVMILVTKLVSKVPIWKRLSPEKFHYRSYLNHLPGKVESLCSLASLELCKVWSRWSLICLQNLWLQKHYRSRSRGQKRNHATGLLWQIHLENQDSSSQLS